METKLRDSFHFCLFVQYYPKESSIRFKIILIVYGKSKTRSKQKRRRLKYFSSEGSGLRVLKWIFDQFLSV